MTELRTFQPREILRDSMWESNLLPSAGVSRDAIVDLLRREDQGDSIAEEVNWLYREGVYDPDTCDVRSCLRLARRMI